MTETTTAAALEGLAGKLGGLELNEQEGALLDELLRRAGSAGSDVEGFGVVFVGGWGASTYRYAVGGDSQALAEKLAVGLGLDPGGVWTDMRPPG